MGQAQSEELESGGGAKTPPPQNLNSGDAHASAVASDEGPSAREARCNLIGGGGGGEASNNQTKAQPKTKTTPTTTTTTATTATTNGNQHKYKRNLQRAAAALAGALGLADKGRARDAGDDFADACDDIDDGYEADDAALAREHVRKLSNRNIQLLSMRPRNEMDSFADGLRARRRSSLINLILGAPSRGPRFSDDLCSLSSHMSELCNFGIDYFPDTLPVCPAKQGLQQQQQQGALCRNGPTTTAPGSVSSTASSLERLDDSFISGGRALSSAAGRLRNAEQGPPKTLAGDFRKPSLACKPSRRRRSSLGSLASFEVGGARKAGQSGPFPVADAAAGGEFSKVNAQLKLEAEAEAEAEKNCCQTAGDNNSAWTKQSARQLSPASKYRDYQLDEAAGGAGNSKAVVRPSLGSIFFASIDLSSGEKLEAADEERDETWAGRKLERDAKPPTAACDKAVAAKRRINHAARRMLHRSGSELSLYSSGSAASGSLSRGTPFYAAAEGGRARRCSRASASIGSVMLEAGYATATCRSVAGRASQPGSGPPSPGDRRPAAAATTAGSNSATASAALRERETKLIIMLQVCLPFILAGFGNMAAGLALNRIAHWDAFKRVPIFFVLLPSFVGLKGNIEMTLASRLSTLSNLKLLDTSHQQRRAFATNLVLILSQAIGLSLFAASAAIGCELALGKLSGHGQLKESAPQPPGLQELASVSLLIVLPTAFAASISLVCVSSCVTWLSIWLAKQLQVNPDNLSTLIAALYGDVSCVLTYGLIAQLMYAQRQEAALVVPIVINLFALISWPLVWYKARKFEETRALSLWSMPPMLAAIVVSLGSGAILSLVVERFKRIALYQPVVNGFGANLIAVQASRVSTWLWCGALRRISLTAAGREEARAGAGHKLGKAPQGSLASFVVAGDEAGPTARGGAACKRAAGPVARVALAREAGGKGAGGGAALFICNQREPAQAPAGARERCSRLKRRLATSLKRRFKLALKLVRLPFWSFCNSSPNALAARLLLVMLVPAHSIYFVVIWLLAPKNYVQLTWPFYASYITLCLIQVFLLLAICQPLMTQLMRRRLDPDIFGISLLMALADLIGTLCLTAAFQLLALIGDANAF